MGSLKLHWSKFVLWCFLAIIYTAFVTSSFNDDSFNITCQYDEECSTAVNGSLCDVERQCYCPDNIPIFVNDSDPKINSSFCLKSLNLTEKGCIYSQQCNYEHSACWKRTCLCAPRYRVKEGICQGTLGCNTINGPMACPACSPDRTPLDYFLWSHLKSSEYKMPVESVEELVAAGKINSTPALCKLVHHSFIYRCLCNTTLGRHFKQLLRVLA